MLSIRGHENFVKLNIEGSFLDTVTHECGQVTDIQRFLLKKSGG